MGLFSELMVGIIGQYGMIGEQETCGTHQRAQGQGRNDAGLMASLEMCASSMGATGLNQSEMMTRDRIDVLAKPSSCLASQVEIIFD